MAVGCNFFVHVVRADDGQMKLHGLLVSAVQGEIDVHFP